MTKMVTKLGLVVLLVTGVLLLAISVIGCVRRLKQTKNPDILNVAWVLARISFCAIVLALAENDQILHADFFALMPAMVLAYEIASLHIIRFIYKDRTIKFDKVYAHLSQTAILAVISIYISKQEWFFGMRSVFVLTIIDGIALANTTSLLNEEIETKTDA